MYNFPAIQPHARGSLSSQSTEPELEKFFSPFGARNALLKRYEKSLNVLLRLNCLKIVKDQDESEEQHSNYSIIFICSGQDGQGFEWSLKNIFTTLLLTLSSFYVVVEHLLRVYFFRRLDLHREKLETLGNLTESSRSVRLSQSLLEEHEQLAWWSSRLSLSYWPNGMFGRMFLANLWPMAFAFSLITLCRIIFQKEKLQIDALAFILTPEQECRRTQQEIDTIIETLAWQTMNSVDSRRFWPSEECAFSLNRQKQDHTDELGRKKSYSADNYLRPSERSRNGTNLSFVSPLEARELVETLKRIKKRRLVRLATLDRKLGSVLLPSLVCGVSAGLLFSYYVTFAFFIPVTSRSFSIFQRASQSTRRIENLEWNTGQIHAEIVLNSSKSICHELDGFILGQAYDCMGIYDNRSEDNRSSKNSTEEKYQIRFHVDILQVLPFTDMKNYVKHFWLVLFEVSVFAIISECVVALWLSLQFVTSVIQVHWIWQIKNQFQLCAKLAEQLSLRRQQMVPRQSTSAGNHTLRERSESANEEIKLAQDQRSLLEYLTICYVNYTLFRRHHERSKRLMNFFISQIAICAISSYSSVYLSIDFHKCNWKHLMLGTGFVLALCNIYLVTACLISKSFENMVKQHYYLMAHLARGPLEPKSTLIVDLWARQLLVRREIEDFIGPKFLHVRISVEKFFSINTYVFLFWFLMIRLNLQEQNSSWVG